MKNKHMTIHERIKIQIGLESRHSFKQIAEDTGKDCTSISREVRRHIIVKKTGYSGRPFNDCVHRRNCSTFHSACNNEKCNRNRCTYCKQFCMTQLCTSYTKEKCPNLKKAPYVCNGCTKVSTCQLEKHFYNAKDSQQQYEVILSASRSGFAIGEEEAKELGNVLKQGLSKGHSVYHIMKSVGEEVVGYSSRTIYTYIDAGIFEDVGNLDLPRKVRYKARKKGNVQPLKKDKTCRIGRTYADYILFMQENPDTPVVQMDTVVGKKGVEEKVLLTIHILNCRLMLAFLRDCNSASSVVDVFDMLKLKLGCDDFVKIFPLLLTDNGSEFSDPVPIETDSSTGELLSRVFYCDQNMSQQKGACENNHEFIRRVIPKGRSMNPFSQEDIDLMMSHINSYLRAELGGKSPYDMFEFLYGRNILDKLNLRRINPKDVILKPELLLK